MQPNQPAGDVPRGIASIREALTPTVQFAALSLTIMLILGIGLAWFLADQTQRQILGTFGDLVGREVAYLIRPQIFASDLDGPMTLERREALNEFITSINLHVHYERIKIFNPQGVIVFSDEFALIGKQYELDEGLHAVLQKGEIYATLSDENEAENFSEAGLGHMVEIYVPLIPSDSEQIAGAYEVYIDYHAIEVAVQRQRLWIWVGVGSALVLLWVGMISIFQRATLAIEEQRKLAMIDPLTGISNRRYFLQNLHLEVERYRRYRRVFSLIILDIDHFKSFNDIFGHPVGDQVLKAVAMQMEENTRGTDIIARYGGEEFVILLPETSLGLAAWVADRLREAITQMSNFDRQVTVSIGVASYQGGDAEELIQRADEALYQAKNSGRNRVEIASEVIKEVL